MVKSFKELIVWQKAHELVLEVYRLTMKFPKKEDYCLTAQIRRSAISSAANIVEGHKRKTDRDFLHFLNIAQGSLEETKYHILLSRDLKYISDSEYKELLDSCESVGKLLNGLVKSMEKNK